MSHRSIEAAKIIWENMISAMGAREILKLNQGIARVEILTPTRGNEVWANASLVVHLHDGSRYGLEVKPIPDPPAAMLRAMDDTTSDPHAPYDTPEPEPTEEPEETTPPEPDPADDPSEVEVPADPPVPGQTPYTP